MSHVRWKVDWNSTFSLSLLFGLLTLICYFFPRKGLSRKKDVVWRELSRRKGAASMPRVLETPSPEIILDGHPLKEEETPKIVGEARMEEIKRQSVNDFLSPCDTFKGLQAEPSFSPLGGKQHHLKRHSLSFVELQRIAQQNILEAAKTLCFEAPVDNPFLEVPSEILEPNDPSGLSCDSIGYFGDYSRESGEFESSFREFVPLLTQAQQDFYLENPGAGCQDGFYQALARGTPELSDFRTTANLARFEPTELPALGGTPLVQQWTSDSNCGSPRQSDTLSTSDDLPGSSKSLWVHRFHLSHTKFQMEHLSSRETHEGVELDAIETEMSTLDSASTPGLHKSDGEDASPSETGFTRPFAPYKYPKDFWNSGEYIESKFKDTHAQPFLLSETYDPIVNELKRLPKDSYLLDFPEQVIIPDRKEWNREASIGNSFNFGLRTTLRLQGLGPNITDEKLLSFLWTFFQLDTDDINFYYIPMNQMENISVGYVFVNFKSISRMNRLQTALSGNKIIYEWSRISWNYARVQGLANLKNLFRNHKLKHNLPMTIHNGLAIPVQPKALMPEISFLK